MRRGNVLIVDNDEQTLCKLQTTLENAGFETTATWSGHEALSLLRAREFSVLIVDNYLPDLYSHDFLRRVNRLPIQPFVVVMHTQAAKPDDLRCYESLGIFDLVDKRDSERVCRAVSFCCSAQPLARKSVN